MHAPWKPLRNAMHAPWKPLRNAMHAPWKPLRNAMPTCSTPIVRWAGRIDGGAESPEYPQVTPPLILPEPVADRASRSGDRR